MISINEAVIVEGKYDKIKLSSIIDAVIIETNGFSIFTDKETQALIRRLAMTRGVIIVTDSDAAGFRIRSFIGGSLPKDRVKHVYIPDIYGKEGRKPAPSKEGKLGVEGVPKQVILDSFKRAGVVVGERTENFRRITKTDFYEDGLTGAKDSSKKRSKLLEKLSLPSRLSANALIDVLNAMMSFEEYKSAVSEL